MSVSAKNTSPEQQVLIDWLKNCETEAALEFISRMACLDVEIIKTYYQKGNPTSWNFNDLAWNENTPWSMELIDFIKDDIDWTYLLYNQTVPWSIELMDAFKDKLDLGSQYHMIYYNPKAPWSIELIERFAKQWNWKKLSACEYIPWTDELIDQFKRKWDWWELSENPSLPWNEELIERYEKEWSWEALSRNQALPLTAELIERFKKKWKWKSFSSHSKIPWSNELLEKYIKKWNFSDDGYGDSDEDDREICHQGLSTSRSLPWSIDLIEKYKDKWAWYELARNPAIPWDMDYFEKFDEELSRCYGNFSGNKAVVWTEGFIGKNQEQLFWGAGLNSDTGDGGEFSLSYN